MASDETYNGWTNRETWLVNLWLSNDQGTYNYVRDLIAERIASDMDTDDYILGEIVQEATEDIIFGDEAPASLGTDLITHALAVVDWREIAQAFRE